MKHHKSFGGIVNHDIVIHDIDYLARIVSVPVINTMLVVVGVLCI